MFNFDHHGLVALAGVVFSLFLTVMDRVRPSLHACYLILAVSAAPLA